MPSLAHLQEKLLKLLPTLSVKGVVHHLHPLPGLTLYFDPRCGGIIERSWAEVFRLCAECGCVAHFEWFTQLTTKTVLDTESAAPDYSSENLSTVRLTVEQRQGQEVAA